MPVYTVHAPLNVASTRASGDGFVFVRDGFRFWAFVTGLFWLLYHRLWIATIGYAVVMVGVVVLLARLHVGATAEWTVLLLIAILMGLEASSLQRWTLSRRKWRQVDVIVAADEQAAERRFFERWTAQQADDPRAVDRGDPPPTRDMPGQPFSRPLAHSDILGLFPQPGASG